MKICFPIDEDNGTDSRIAEHFGTAAKLMVIDPETGITITFPNRCATQSHRCLPCRTMRGMTVDSLVVHEVGASALKVLREYGIQVFRGEAVKVSETLRLMRDGEFSYVAARGCPEEMAAHCLLQCPCARYQAGFQMMHPGRHSAV